MWNVSSDALDVGLLPTQRAQPNPLAVMFSTAGTEASASMLRWREQGVRAIDDASDAGLLLLEWSAPPELDPMSPAAWAYANPALGHTLKLATIEREAASPNRAAFLRSSVNLWVQSDRSWLSPGAWQACATENRPLDGGVVAIEVALDDARYWAVRVNRNSDGQLVATVEFVTETMEKTWDKIGTLAADPKLVIAITPTLDVHTPGHLKKRVQIVGYQEITRYTAAVRQMILERRILHTGEAMLAEHVGRAVAARTGGTIALSSRTSPGPIELARCLVWAAGIAASAPRTARPIVATAGPSHRVA